MLPFALTIFLSAFLLFHIQPLISRYILPWFGGTPAVWSSAMLFFQVLLLAGYAYAHWIVAGGQKRILFHLCLLIAGCILLAGTAAAWGTPLLPGPSWRPPDSSYPLLRILLVLSIGAGLPYFILSSTSPLLQAWSHLLFPNRVPYRLYALSNLGSFLALLSYPLLLEPLLRLKEQSSMWSIGFILFAGSCALLAVRVNRSSAANPPPSTLSPNDAASPGAPAPPAFTQFLWIAQAGTSSVLLLAVTNQLTQEVAVIPFLWVLPLSIYLFSFTLTFSGERWYPRNLAILLLGVATLLLTYAIQFFETMGVVVQIGIYAIFLFMATVVLHGELYRLRPAPRYLTSFYLMVSAGGAAGGIFVNLVAPYLFNGFWELYAGVGVCWLLIIVALTIDHGSILHRRIAWLAVPLILAVLVTNVYVSIQKVRANLAGVLDMNRNFYGVFRVRSIWAGEPAQVANALNHGITSHGFQFTSPDFRRVPTTYYGPESGIGRAITAYRNLLQRSDPGRGLRLGVVGLGTGTLAAYSERGDSLRFYEINPDIIELAKGEGGYFTYLQDSPAEITVIPGDARLSLEDELHRGQPQQFDILVVDAFSSDSIPVHLLTEEAFQVYLDHIHAQGVLAIHISNRYLDLAPLIQRQASLFGLQVSQINGPRTDEGSYPSVWMLLSNYVYFFYTPEIITHQVELPPEREDLRPWTDDYSNLVQVLRWGPSLNLK